MRIGKRMWEVLEVLGWCYDKGLTTTEIILKIKGLKPYKSKYVQAELASALRGESVSYPYVGSDDGDKLYALYGRSIKLLYKNKLIFPIGNNKTKRKFKITTAGRTSLLNRIFEKFKI